jgi:Squalene-hopene cyclase C-terminal domain
VLALRAARRSSEATPVRSAARYIARSQNGDGWFSFAAGGGSDVDDTGAALQALAAAGRRRSRTSGRALAYLRRQQNADGGFGQLAHSRSNAQSTAWAIQALVANGHDPDRFRAKGGRSALAYLRSLQQEDGSFRYSRTSEQTPVWVTAQALAALRRKPLPLAPVKRVRKAQASVRRGPRSAPAKKQSLASRHRRASARGTRGVTAVDTPRDLDLVPTGSYAARSNERQGEGASLPPLLVLGTAAVASAAAGLLGFKRLRG